jgi:hypothetical protein
MRRFLLTVILLVGNAIPLMAEDCPKEPGPSLRQAAVLDFAGHFILRATEGDQGGKIIEHSCFTHAEFLVGKSRSRWLYFSIINYVPEDQVSGPAFLGIQAIRTVVDQPLPPTIKIFRNGGDWYSEAPERGPLVRAGRINGRQFEHSIDEWNAIHSGSARVTQANQRIGAHWHGRPAVDSESTWAQRQNWQLDRRLPNGSLITNLLLRFTINNDPKHVSLINFSIGVPEKTSQIVLRLHSNVDVFKKNVRIIFPN